MTSIPRSKYQQTKSIEVTQKIDFSCSYITYRKWENSNTKVPTLGSYRYRFEATVVNPLKYDEQGRVISFENLKYLLSQVVFDKFFLYDELDHKQDDLVKAFNGIGIATYGFDGEISAEILLERISLRLVEVVERYGLGTMVKETKLRETANSYVTWRKDN